MPGRQYSSTTGYRYGFNGKEKDKEVVQYDYGMRIYDPRLVRFKSVDPLTKGFPMLTPYQYASNSPIENIDLDGLEKISVHTANFAPWMLFAHDKGGAYVGDGENRKFGDGGTARVHGYVKLDLSTSVIIEKKGYEALTIYMGNGQLPNVWPYNYPRSDYSDTQVEGANITTTSTQSNLSFHIAGNNDAGPAGVPTPDIDSRVSFSYTKFSENVFGIAGEVYGDRFPANETYITDEKDNKLILGVTGAAGSAADGPYKYVPGDNKLKMSKFNLIVTFNTDNTFKTVQAGNTGKVMTIAEWNAQFTKLDPKNTSTGTDVGNNGVSTDYKPEEEHE